MDSANDIPEHLLRGGREADPVFEPDEQLFRRFTKDQVAADGKLVASAIGYDG